MITLTYETTTVTLPADLLWVDEYSYRPVEQTVTPTLTGGVVVEAAVRTAGMPITLQPEDASSAWMTRATLDAITAIVVEPGAEMALNIRGTAYSVVFRHQDGAMDVTPVVHYSTADATDFYLVTLRFMRI